MKQAKDMFSEVKALPVVVIKDVNDTIPTLSALCEGGLPAAEITFRTACAADAIRIGVENLLPENFNSAEAMMALIEKLQGVE